MTNQSNTGDRLKEVMEKTGLKQADILRLALPYCAQYGVKIGRNDLSQYVSGKVTPRKEKLAVLARALGVSEAWLLGYDTEEPDSRVALAARKTRVRKIPLLGTIACGTPIYAEENIEDYIGCPDAVDADFCLRCRGDSMIGARIFDGDIVYIKAMSEVPDREIAAVLIGDEATLKRVTVSGENGGTVTLEPENPAYAPLVYRGKDMEEIRILGKAVWFLSRVR